LSDTETVTAPEEAPPRARGLGFLAGLIGIGCCVYPVAVFLIGAATATEAVALGNNLFGTWGWAFKLGGAGLGIAGVAYQLSKRGQCNIGGAVRARAYIARVVAIGVVTYFVIYAVTKALGNAA